MDYTNKDTDGEMSMEDILSSIRKYVSEDNKESNGNHEDCVEETRSQPEYDVTRDNVISLNESQIIQDKGDEQPKITKSDSQVYNERSSLSMEVVNPDQTTPMKKLSPFEQLTNALNSYGKNKATKAQVNTAGSRTVDQLFSEIAEKVVQQWVDSRMEEFVEKIVMREIEKIKAE